MPFACRASSFAELSVSRLGGILTGDGSARFQLYKRWINRGWAVKYGACAPVGLVKPLACGSVTFNMPYAFLTTRNTSDDALSFPLKIKKLVKSTKACTEYLMALQARNG